MHPVVFHFRKVGQVSPAAFLFACLVVSVICLGVYSNYFAESYAVLNKVTHYECFYGKSYLGQGLCSENDCKVVALFNIQEFKPPSKYQGESLLESWRLSEIVADKLDKLISHRSDSSSNKLDSSTVCTPMESVCYEPQWSFSTGFMQYSTIHSGMITMDKQNAMQVLSLVSNNTNIPYNCFQRQNVVKFHVSQLPINYAQSDLNAMIITASVSVFFLIVALLAISINFYICIRRGRRRAIDLTEEKKTLIRA